MLQNYIDDYSREAIASAAPASLSVKAISGVNESLSVNNAIWLNDDVLLSTADISSKSLFSFNFTGYSDAQGLLITPITFVAQSGLTVGSNPTITQFALAYGGLESSYVAVDSFLYRCHGKVVIPKMPIASDGSESQYFGLWFRCGTDGTLSELYEAGLRIHTESIQSFNPLK